LSWRRPQGRAGRGVSEFGRCVPGSIRRRPEMYPVAHEGYRRSLIAVFRMPYSTSGHSRRSRSTRYFILLAIRTNGVSASLDALCGTFAASERPAGARGCTAGTDDRHGHKDAMCGRARCDVAWRAWSPERRFSLVRFAGWIESPLHPLKLLEWPTRTCGSIRDSA